MSKNSFRIPKFVDHVIENEDGLVVGTLRIKPMRGHVVSGGREEVA
jgi:hypothetical protein